MISFLPHCVAPMVTSEEVQPSNGVTVSRSHDEEHKPLPLEEPIQVVEANHTQSAPYSFPYVCLCVCIFCLHESVCIYVCLFVYMYVTMCVYVLCHVCMSVCLCVHLYLSLCVCVYICMHVGR